MRTVMTHIGRQLSTPCLWPLFRLSLEQIFVSFSEDDMLSFLLIPLIFLAGNLTRSGEYKLHRYSHLPFKAPSTLSPVHRPIWIPHGFILN